jgi:hypothetical protein
MWVTGSYDVNANQVLRALSRDETADLLTALKIGAPNEAVSDQVEAVTA